VYAVEAPLSSFASFAVGVARPDFFAAGRFSLQHALAKQNILPA
jgi:hypothetical protein